MHRPRVCSRSKALLAGVHVMLSRCRYGGAPKGEQMARYRQGCQHVPEDTNKMAPTAVLFSLQKF